MERQVAHLQMVQAVITRMAGNSFLIKGWSVTLVVALFALAAASTNEHFVLLAYFPAFMFWSLDAYFLRQERLFRKLYDKVRKLPGASVDYSMDRSDVSSGVASWLGTVFSKTLLSFHGVLVATITLVAAYVAF